MTSKSLVKKPEKKHLATKARIDLDTIDLNDMFNANMDMEVILECPNCKIQQVMTLEEYFTKIDYDYRDNNKKLLKCELCKGHPELMFFKVDHMKILLAGANWERKQLGISEEKMAGMIKTYTGVNKAIKAKRKPKEISG